MLSYDDRFLRFSFAIDRIAKSLQRIKNEKLARFDLRSMHLMCLFQLDKHPEGLTGAELSRNCQVDKAFVSRVTGELCRADYISYSDREGSRYNNKFILTDAGKAAMGQIRIILEDAVTQITAGITDEQLLQFYQILEQLDNGLSRFSEGRTDTVSTKTAL